MPKEKCLAKSFLVTACFLIANWCSFAHSSPTAEGAVQEVLEALQGEKGLAGFQWTPALALELCPGFGDRTGHDLLASVERHNRAMAEDLAECRRDFNWVSAKIEKLGPTWPEPLDTLGFCGEAERWHTVRVQASNGQQPIQAEIWLYRFRKRDFVAIDVRCGSPTAGAEEDGKPPPTEPRFVSVSAGNERTCIADSARAFCFGKPTGVENDTIARQTYLLFGGGILKPAYKRALENARITEVLAGERLTAVLRAGKVADLYGMLLDPPQGHVPLNVLYDAQAIALGDQDGCVLDTGQQIRCWGPGAGRLRPSLTRYQQIALNLTTFCGIRESGEIECLSFEMSGHSIPPKGKFKHISGAGGAFCAISNNGELLCWGSVSTPNEAINQRFLEIGIGISGKLCALGKDQTASCWGGNEIFNSPPKEKLRTISVGASHACGLTLGGHVRCWGSNAYGESIPRDSDDPMY